jgi:hypothetical protein
VRRRWNGPIFVLTHHPEDATAADGVTFLSCGPAEAVRIGLEAAAGGRDNGSPGLRELYHPTYYGAFVLNPDGNNIEAVCHHPHPNSRMPTSQPDRVSQTNMAATVPGPQGSASVS